MDTNLLNAIESFSRLKVLVIGEAMLDSYLKGTTDRLCREAPVPVVSIQEREHVPGGAANTAVNARALGADVYFLSVTGDDHEGHLLRTALEENAVSTEHVLMNPERTTLAKQRIIATSQMVVRFDQGSIHPLSPRIERAIIRRLKMLYPAVDAVIISDYGYGVLTPSVVRTISELQAAHPRVLILDSKRLGRYGGLQVTAVKPNYDEALHLLGVKKPRQGEDRAALIGEYGEKILDVTGAQLAFVTLDQDGAIVFERGQVPYRTYAHPEPNTRAAGAGDTFVSAVALALATGTGTENAAEIASAAASIVVGKENTAICYLDELRASLLKEDKVITDAFQLAARLATYRRENRRVVFTNGCFDILHRGHINYLNRSKAFGDVLIVGMNSDTSVQRLKGPSRPINNLEDRAQILAALSCVDHIVPFDGDTPHELIRIIQPDIFVKGGDYTRETLPEASLVEELGGEVKILPYLEDHSTTNIIERIRKLYIDTPAK